MERLPTSCANLEPALGKTSLALIDVYHLIDRDNSHMRNHGGWSLLVARALDCEFIHGHDDDHPLR